MQPESLQPDSFFERKVEQVSSNRIRALPDNGPKSIPVEVTSVSIFFIYLHFLYQSLIPSCKV